MFNCKNHGWTSFEKPCSICNPVITFSSNSATTAIIGVSGSSWSDLHEQIEFLKAENARYREALKSILLHGTCVENCGYHVDEAREALKGE